MNQNNWISLVIPDEIRGDIYNSVQYIDQHIKDLIGTDKVEFMPMDYNDIHMTLVFCGEHLRKLNKDQQAKIKEIIDKFKQSYTVKFDKYMLFPPNKENLIIALFTLEKSCLTSIYNMKKELVQYGIPLDAEFIPHITLGKIKYMKPEYVKTIKLSDIPKITDTFTTSGGYLCGK
jgi:2'-5' RNA ligase